MNGGSAVAAAVIQSLMVYDNNGTPTPEQLTVRELADSEMEDRGRKSDDIRLELNQMDTLVHSGVETGGSGGSMNRGLRAPGGPE